MDATRPGTGADDGGELQETTWVRACASVCMRVWAVCLCVYSYVSVCGCVSVCINVCLFVYMCVCVCVCVCVPESGV